MVEVDYVDAVFDGKEVRFRLRREERFVSSIEGALGSTFAAFGRFGNGEWKTSDVRHTLALAYPGVRPLYQFTECPDVDRVLTDHPPGLYAPLAVKILKAFLFGIDEEMAVFDEAER